MEEVVKKKAGAWEQTERLKKEAAAWSRLMTSMGRVWARELAEVAFPREFS